MRRLLLAAIGLAASLMLANCATTARIAAASDVHALLIAIRDDDDAAFQARVDKPALERELEDRLLERSGAASDPSVAALGSLFARPLAKLAGEALLRPDVFRSVAQYYGYTAGAPLPNQFAIAAALRPLPDGRVCAARRHGGPCLITFAHENGTWRLVSFDGDLRDLHLSR
jgi:hypothetical protein